jgi:hypothetical protein
MYNNLHKYKSVILFALKLLIIGGAYYFIVHKISNNLIFSTTDSLEFLKKNLFGNFWVIVALFSFTLANWFFEILKWKNLISSFKHISFYEASKQSLASLTASLLTPNRVGEYGAKAIYYNKQERYKVLFLNFISNLSQLLVTIFFGLIGILFLSNNSFFTLTISWEIIVSILLITSLLFGIIPSKFWMPYWIKLKLNFKKINPEKQQKNIAFSIVRYLVFSHQFYFLLLIFGITLDYTLSMSLIFAMYFIASIIPSFVVFDWLIKGSVAVSLFSLFEVPELVLLSITSLMWLFNFAIPAILGSYFVLTFNKTTAIPVLSKSAKA